MSFQGAIAFASELIRIPSLPGQEGALAGRVMAEFERLGFDESWVDEVGNCFARVKGRTAAAPLMLSCHLDMVDVGDAESWEVPPFEGRIADGFLHGRGAMDIKGPLALQTYAAAQFIADRPERDIVVAHTVFEEKGGWGMQYLLDHCQTKPAAVIIGEATNGDVCIGHRGRAEIVVEITGVAGHASAPERALNPIDLLPSVLPRLKTFAASLPAHDQLGASTAVPTQIETLPRSRNVIPDTVRVIVDWRVLPGLSADRAVELVRAELASVTLPAGFGLVVRLNTEPQRSYTGLERDRPMFTPGFLIDRNNAVVRAAVDAIADRGNPAPLLRPWTFATDGGHVCGVHGIPCIGYAPGEERYAHTNRERLDLAQAEAVYTTYPAVIRRVMGSLS